MNSKTRHIFEQLLEFYTQLNDTYRVRAYRNALDDPSVMGESLRRKVKEINETGTLMELQYLKQYRNLLKVRGIGPKFVKKLMLLNLPIETLQYPPNLLKISSLKLTDAQKIALVHYKELSSKIKRSTITSYLKDVKIPDSIAVGSYRRGLKSSNDIDILVRKTKIEPSEILGYLATLMKGKSKISIIAKYKSNVFQVDILLVPEDEYWTSLLYFTGSKDFNIKMRAHAKKNGYLLNEHGLYKVLSGKKIPVSSERKIFDVIGYKWVEPYDRN